MSQDTTVVAHAHGHALTFKHPAVQSACMFAGEFMCLLIYIAMQVGLLRSQCVSYALLLASGNVLTEPLTTSALMDGQRLNDRGKGLRVAQLHKV